MLIKVESIETCHDIHSVPYCKGNAADLTVLDIIRIPLERCGITDSPTRDGSLHCAVKNQEV